MKIKILNNFRFNFLAFHSIEIMSFEPSLQGLSNEQNEEFRKWYAKNQASEMPNKIFAAGGAHFTPESWCYSNATAHDKYSRFSKEGIVELDILVMNIKEAYERLKSAMAACELAEVWPAAPACVDDTLKAPDGQPAAEATAAPIVALNKKIVDIKRQMDQFIIPNLQGKLTYYAELTDRLAKRVAHADN
jgi:hypothetical protein